MSQIRQPGAHRAVQIRPRSRGPLAVPRPAISRHIRRRHSLPLFAAFATLAFVLVSVVDPYSGAYAATPASAGGATGPVQKFVAGGAYSATTAIDTYTAAAPPPPVVVATKSAGGGSAPAAGTPDPGTAQAIAHDMLVARGLGEDQYNCLVALWNKESHWNVYAHNTGSGAYGIPQALPGSKMASAGADWATNPATQITWGLGYIEGRYSTPCGAWAKSQASGWY